MVTKRIRVGAPLALLVVALTGAGCGSSKSSTPAAPKTSSVPTSTPESAAGGGGVSGSITLSGSLTGTLSATSSVVACSVSTGTLGGPQGQLIFGSGAGAVTLAFDGPTGSHDFPSFNGASLIVTKGDAQTSTLTDQSTTYSGASHASSGSLTTSGTGPGSVHGHADAELAAAQGGGSVHITGSWTC